MLYFGYGDRMIAADEIERLRERVTGLNTLEARIVGLEKEITLLRDRPGLTSLYWKQNKQLAEAVIEIERFRVALREVLFEASTIQRAAEIARVALQEQP
jgi:hypothetical protein